MFKAILYSQWKTSRWLIAVGTVASFAIPVLSVRQLGVPSPAPWQAVEALNAVQAWGLWYPLLAFVLTGLLSTYTWHGDITGKHVYALSLPVPRWNYVLMRLSAGLVLLALPVIAVWVGSLVAVSGTTIPQGLHAYPHALALRFALAVLVLYTGLAGLTAMPKQIQLGIGSAVGLLVTLEILSALVGAHVGFATGPLATLFEWPGPLQILFARWVLIDV